MHLRRSIALILFFVLAWLSDTAAPIDSAGVFKKSVKGRVSSAESGDALGFSVIGVYRSSDSTLFTGMVADQNGAFTVVFETSSDAYLKISCVGCNARFIPVPVNSAASQNIGNIRLKSSAQLREIEIVDDKPAYRVEDDKKIYLVDKDPAAANGSLSDVLQNIPSVFVDMDGNIRLRGGSVRILINGQPTSAFGMGRREVLGFLPANMVENIEVINNPSARYDANGEAGIINVVLKKPKESGVHGLFMGGIGTLDNYNASGRVTYRNKKWSVSVSDNLRNSNMTGTTDKNREINTNTLYYVNQHQDWSDRNLTNVLGTRIAFTPDTLNEITASLLYAKTKGTWDAYTWYRQEDQSHALTEVYDRLSPDRDNDKSTDVNIGYTRKFKRKDESLSGLFVYNDSRDISTSNYILHYYDPATLEPYPVDPLTQLVTETTDMTRNIVQLDYDLPFGKKNKIECGGKTSFRYTDQDYLFQKYDWNTDEYFNVTDFSNHFRQKERINAAYVSYRKSFGRYSAKAGLRTEQTIWDTELLTTGQTNHRDFIDLFPSAHLIRKFSGSNTVTLGYSRRINRPSIRMLNPFMKFVDAITIRTGNPDLSPEYTHSFDLSYTKGWKKSTLNGSIYYRSTDSSMHRVSLIDANNNAVTTYRNFLFDKDLGLELFFTTQVNKWYRFNTGYNVYGTWIDGTNVDATYRSDNLNMNAKVNNYFTVNSTLLFQLTGNYVAPVNTPVTKSASVFYSDFSMRKDLLGKRLTCSVRVSDIFHTRRQNSELLNEVYHIYTYSRRESRQVFLSITYRPGIYKLKNKPKEEEEFPEDAGERDRED